MAYGGAHVSEDLIAGKPVLLRASSYGTDCYPNRAIETYITKDSLNQAYLFNPRNAYQNYAAAVNSGNRTLYTYMGTLLPPVRQCHLLERRGAEAPLINDPCFHCRGGGRASSWAAPGAMWLGRAPSTTHPRPAVQSGVPLGAAGTLALIGDLKKMDTAFIPGRPLPQLRHDPVRRGRHPHPHLGCGDGPFRRGSRMKTSTLPSSTTASPNGRGPHMAR